MKKPMALWGMLTMAINLANLRLYDSYPLVCLRVIASGKSNMRTDDEIEKALEKAYYHMPWVILDEFEKMLNEPKETPRTCRSPPMNDYMDGR